MPCPYQCRTGPRTLAVTDRGQQALDVAGIPPPKHLVSKLGQLPRSGSLSRRAIIIGRLRLWCLPRPVVPPDETGVVHEVADSRMRIAACQASADVARDSPPSGYTPTHHQPDYDVSTPQQLVGPPQIDAFGDPGGLGSNGPSEGDPRFQRPRIRARAGIFVCDIIEVVDLYTQLGTQASSQRRLSAGRPPNDMDTTDDSHL